MDNHAGLFRVTLPSRCNCLIIFWRPTLLLQHKGLLCTIIHWKMTKFSQILDIRNGIWWMSQDFSDPKSTVSSWIASGGITGKFTVLVLFSFFLLVFLLRWFFNYSKSYLAAEEKCCRQWCQPPIIRHNQNSFGWSNRWRSWWWWTLGFQAFPELQILDMHQTQCTHVKIK